MAEREPHVAQLSGEIDIENAERLERDLLAELDGASGLIVDLTGVTYFDSSGLRMLDAVARACDAAGLSLRVVAPSSGRARYVLRIVAWPEHLLAESLDDARAAV